MPEDRETPYVVTWTTNRVHLASCGVGGHGRPLAMAEVLHRFGQEAADKGYLGRHTADCCGASPCSWLKHNHPDRLPDPTRSEGER